MIITGFAVFTVLLLNYLDATVSFIRIVSFPATLSCENTFRLTESLPPKIFKNVNATPIDIFCQVFFNCLSLLANACRTCGIVA